MPLITYGILTVSDSCYAKENVDKSGPLLKKLISTTKNLEDYESRIECCNVVPDKISAIEAILIEWSDKRGINVIFTTGGTGFSPRDVTPEATKNVIQRETPGFTHAMFTKSYEATPLACLSRAASGIRGKTLIINFPGSPKAVEECYHAVQRAIPHAVDLLCDQLQFVKDTHAKILKQEKLCGCSHKKGNVSLNLNNVAGRLRESPYPMITIEESQDILLKTCDNDLPFVTIDIWECLGRVLAETVYSPCNLPPFRASIKDGYAVIASDGKGKRLVLSGIEAGHEPEKIKIKPGTCVRINTGAPVPHDADAVVQVEDTILSQATPDGNEELEIEILTEPVVGQDIRENDMFLALEGALGNADVIVTTGSVSMGDRDMLKPMLEKRFNAKIHFVLLVFTGQSGFGHGHGPSVRTSAPESFDREQGETRRGPSQGKSATICSILSTAPFYRYLHRSCIIIADEWILAGPASRIRSGESGLDGRRSSPQRLQHWKSNQQQTDELPTRQRLAQAAPEDRREKGIEKGRCRTGDTAGIQKRRRAGSSRLRETIAAEQQQQQHRPQRQSAKLCSSDRPAAGASSSSSRSRARVTVSAYVAVQQQQQRRFCAVHDRLDYIVQRSHEWRRCRLLYTAAAAYQRPRRSAGLHTASVCVYRCAFSCVSVASTAAAWCCLEYKRERTECKGCARHRAALPIRVCRIRVLYTCCDDDACCFWPLRLKTQQSTLRSFCIQEASLTSKHNKYRSERRITLQESPTPLSKSGGGGGGNFPDSTTSSRPSLDYYTIRVTTTRLFPLILSAVEMMTISAYQALRTSLHVVPASSLLHIYPSTIACLVFIRTTDLPLMLQITVTTRERE
ncbi:unnamed protein product [Trichogramma brassicae]|uniref:MoaB/Mog domain-containing protein n=1 Tax=Trichogramma brassicae TaxID=86971 RepID=A0A6H5JBB2_9HYME|nr:unnamed protein product [Trichogramma brassicae]